MNGVERNGTKFVGYERSVGTLHHSPPYKSLCISKIQRYLYNASLAKKIVNFYTMQVRLTYIGCTVSFLADALQYFSLFNLLWFKTLHLIVQYIGK